MCSSAAGFVKCWRNLSGNSGERAEPVPVTLATWATRRPCPAMHAYCCPCWRRGRRAGHAPPCSPAAARAGDDGEHARQFARADAIFPAIQATRRRGRRAGYARHARLLRCCPRCPRCPMMGEPVPWRWRRGRRAGHARHARLLLPALAMMGEPLRCCPRCPVLAMMGEPLRCALYFSLQQAAPLARGGQMGEPVPVTLATWATRRPCPPCSPVAAHAGNDGRAGDARQIAHA